MTCSSDTAARVDAEVIAIIERSHKRAKQILKDNEAVLHKLAAHLLERETITGEEFMNLLKTVSSEAAEPVGA